MGCSGSSPTAQIGMILVEQLQSFLRRMIYLRFTCLPFSLGKPPFTSRTLLLRTVRDRPLAFVSDETLDVSLRGCEYTLNCKASLHSNHNVELAMRFNGLIQALSLGSSAYEKGTCLTYQFKLHGSCRHKMSKAKSQYCIRKWV